MVYLEDMIIHLILLNSLPGCFFDTKKFLYLIYVRTAVLFTIPISWWWNKILFNPSVFDRKPLQFFLAVTYIFDRARSFPLMLSTWTGLLKYLIYFFGFCIYTFFLGDITNSLFFQSIDFDHHFYLRLSYGISIGSFVFGVEKHSHSTYTFSDTIYYFS